MKIEKRPAELGDSQSTQLEDLLNEGLDDLDAGRTVARDQMRQEVKALLDKQERERVTRVT